jgi:hypothetical protein
MKGKRVGQRARRKHVCDHCYQAILPRCLIVRRGGTFRIRTVNGNIITFTKVRRGEILPVRGWVIPGRSAWVSEAY